MGGQSGAPNVSSGSQTVRITPASWVGASGRWTTCAPGWVAWSPRPVSTPPLPATPVLHGVLLTSRAAFNFFTHFTFYTTCLCAICLATSVYCLTLQLGTDEVMVDGWVIAIIAMSAFFGLFAFGMTLTAGRYIFTNTTNIDMLRTRQTFNLAVRIPRDTPPSTKYPTITYPLQPAPSLPPSSAGPGKQQDPHGGASAMAARDEQATRRFAILKTEPGENPWNLGLRQNWRSVMGDGVAEWLLPIKHSPCCSRESMASDYPFGPLLEELKTRYGVPEAESAG